MYTNILVPVSFDENPNRDATFRIARALADKDATITLLHVMEPVPGYVASQIPAEVMAESRVEAERRMTALTEQVSGAASMIMSGHAGRAISTYAEREGSDLIVLASHKHGLGDYFIGSTSDWVVRHVNCCVHVVR